MKTRKPKKVMRKPVYKPDRAASWETSPWKPNEKMLEHVLALDAVVKWRKSREGKVHGT